MPTREFHGFVAVLALTLSAGCSGWSEIPPESESAVSPEPPIVKPVTTPAPPATLSAGELADLIDAQLAKVRRIQVAFRLSAGGIADQTGPAAPLGLFTPEFRAYHDAVLRGSFVPGDPELGVTGESSVDFATGRRHLRWGLRVSGGSRVAVSEFLFDGSSGTSLVCLDPEGAQTYATMTAGLPEGLQSDSGYWRPETITFRSACDRSLADAIRGAAHVEVVPDSQEGHPAYRVTLLAPVDVPLEFNGMTVTAQRLDLLRLWLAPEYGLLPVRVDRLQQRDPGDLEGVPSVVHRMSDFREVAAGVWHPFRVHSYNVPTDAAPRVSEVRIESVAVNDEAVVPDRIPLPDGTSVSDDIRQVSYRVGDSEEVIRRGIAERQAERQAWDALVGKPAPPFGELTWINSEPLSWPDLAGRVVILDFWSESCGPCRHDLPVMNELHQQRFETGIVVIGVHAAGSERAAIDALVREMDLSYPIVLDAPAEGEDGFGTLCNRYAVRGLSCACVIDRHGNVAGCGALEDCLAKAEQLAGEPR